MTKKLHYVISFLLLVHLVGCGGSSKKPITPAVVVPGAPTGVAATAADTTVSITWTAVARATSYNVYYSATSGVTTANGTKVSVTPASATITGLTNGTTYYFIVTALDSAGESSAAPQVSAKPVPPIPGAPIGLTAVTGDGQITLTWTAASGAVTYNVYYATATGVTAANGTKRGSITGVTTTITALTNGTPYFFIVTAINLGGESVASAEATATPALAVPNGISMAVTPGAAASGTLPLSSTSSLTFDFAAGTVDQDATVTIAPILNPDLPVPLARRTRTNGRFAPMVSANDTFLAAFKLSVDPVSIAVFNVPVSVGGTVESTFLPGSTINMAILTNNQWVDVATFIVGSTLKMTENIVSVTLPGLIRPGTFLLYEPAKGSNTSVSNLGVVLLADDSNVMSDGSNGLQVVNLYDSKGALLTTPIINLLDYDGAGDLDGQAMTPDGSQGIMVDGGDTLRFFSAVQTGVPLASATNLDVSAYGYDGDSVAIMPNGDEAVVTLDDNSQLELVSGIVAGNPVVSEVIPVPSNRDGLVISNDGTVLLARMDTQIDVFSVAAITPKAGIAGTISHSFTQISDLTSALYANGEDGRDGMAISPVDSSRAIIVGAQGIQMLTGLPSTPVLSTPMDLSPTGIEPLAVSVTPDGKFAVVGGYGGLLLFSGVDTGTLTQVGSLYAPTYTSASGTVTLTNVTTLGITLDGKYAVVGDSYNGSLLVIPFTSAGFGAAPSTIVGPLAIPDNDQLLIH